MRDLTSNIDFYNVDVRFDGTFSQCDDYASDILVCRLLDGECPIRYCLGTVIYWRSLNPLGDFPFIFLALLCKSL